MVSAARMMENGGSAGLPSRHPNTHRAIPGDLALPGGLTAQLTTKDPFR
jgi:hypothetical protein